MITSREKEKMFTLRDDIHMSSQNYEGNGHATPVGFADLCLGWIELKVSLLRPAYLT